ncbi:MAG: hypothetical protein Q4B28_03855 [bacterium]|nr:hypothetical protein [bacterium]
MVTPGAINTLKIDLGEQADFPAGAFIPLQVNAFDSYQNPISRSFDPYLLSADK